ncbi:MAG: hypothetical protein JWR08_1991 [Enterovirga sp.]|nr:hypothetical protein [Enterovirga sp.]
MAVGSFDRALALVLELEGGFVDHPKDPGGATNLGITRATLAQARGRPVSAAEVKALTRAEAGAIYRRLYWNAVAADDLPVGIDLAAFDHAVNSGPARAARALQAVLGLAQDGRIGPQTLAAASDARPDDTVRALVRERLRILRGLPTWPVFGKGWTSRTTRVERTALRLIGGSLEHKAAGAAPNDDPALPFTSEEEENTMTETKTPLASRTVWANLIGLAALGLGYLGLDTGDVDVDALAEAASQIVAGISFLASTFFRLQATKQIAPG